MTGRPHVVLAAALAVCSMLSASGAAAAPRGLPKHLPGGRVGAPQPLAGVVIVVDPGHNGANGRHPSVINRPVDAGGFYKPCNTTGTANSRMTESAFNWRVATLLRTRLTDAGATVVMTRSSDTGVGPCVDTRGKRAKQVNAHLLISIHADGARPSGRGFHVIHPGLRTGYTDRIVAPSTKLATTVRNSLAKEGLTPSTYVGRGGLNQRTDLGTLNWARVPAVMLEAGNMAKPQDAKMLASPSGQAQIADALTEAVIAFS